MLLIGQEGEATADPEGVPWEVDGAEVEEPGGDPEPDGDPEPNGDPQPDGDSELDGEDVDPDDWAEVPSERASAVAASTHGDGDSEGKSQSAKAEAKVTLSAEQADVVITHSSRMSALEQAKDILRTIGGVMGASLSSLVTRVQHIEKKQLRPRLESDAAVAQAMNCLLYTSPSPRDRG